MESICTNCQWCRTVHIYMDGSQDIGCTHNPFMRKLLTENGGSSKIGNNERTVPIQCDEFVQKETEY